MRLSDIKGDRCLDVIAEIIDPLCEIAEDENAKAMFKRVKLPDGETPASFLLGRVRKHIPPILKAHKTALLTILATINGKTAEEYAAELTLQKLFTDCVELISDKSVSELFISAQSDPAMSGSVRETTEGLVV